MSNLTIIMMTVAIYLIWMDVALYVNLQQLPTLNERQSKKQLAEGIPFSPFHPISIKLLMTSPPLHYIDLPLAMWIEESMHVSNFFSANGVSMIGLFCGLVAARLFMCENYKWRLLGFAFFRMRDLMDGLDGVVARAAANQKTMTINPNSWGFAVDGICDGIADVAVIIGTGIFLLKSVSHSTESYQRLDTKSEAINDPKATIWSRLKNLKMQWFMPIVLKVVQFAVTFGACSGLWNYFMYNYSILFDTDLIAQTEHQQAIQLAILKSPIMWLVIFMWRWINAVTMIVFFSVAILYNKSDEFLNVMKQHGWLIVLTASVISYLHYIYALSNISA